MPEDLQRVGCVLYRLEVGADTARLHLEGGQCGAFGGRVWGGKEGDGYFSDTDKLSPLAVAPILLF